MDEDPKSTLPPKPIKLEKRESLNSRVDAVMPIAFLCSGLLIIGVSVKFPTLLENPLIQGSIGSLFASAASLSKAGN